MSEAEICSYDDVESSSFNCVYILFRRYILFEIF